jgi:hypothetical protein
MFRLLIFFIILGFLILGIYAGAQIIKSIKPTQRPKPTTAEDIEELITKIKIKITQADLDQMSGIEGAEKELQYWKDQLAQTQELKEKTKNL